MSQLLDAAETAVSNQTDSAPELDWIRTEAAGRRHRRRLATGAVGVMVVGLAAWSASALLADGVGSDQGIVSVEATGEGETRGDLEVQLTEESETGESSDNQTSNGKSSNESGEPVVASGSDQVDSAEVLDLYQPIPDCPEGRVVPVGQSPMAANFEPLGSIWCFELTDAPAPTAEIGDNSWVDDFNVDSYMHRFSDGDMGYRIFDDAGQSPGRTQHWINQNHWMVDAKGGFTGGASLRPDRSFGFEDGTFVVEADFAAAIPEYAPNAWGELTITSAPEPTGVFADNLYAYGQFGGHWAVGCRLSPDRSATCAVEGPNPESAPDTGQCSAIAGNYRVVELSFFQRCGTEVMGGFTSDDPAEPWRKCEPAGMDMDCRDRFRMEITKDSLTLYVNGELYMRDAGWPEAHQLPDSFVSGDVYAYQSNWQWRSGADTTYRFHWDRFAVNPPTGPSASEWYR